MRFADPSGSFLQLRRLELDQPATPFRLGTEVLQIGEAKQTLTLLSNQEISSIQCQELFFACTRI